MVIMRGVLHDAYLPNDVRLRFLCGGAKAPLFMVHVHPHNYFIWHKVAPDLARDQMVILLNSSEYKGAGYSDKPESVPRCFSCVAALSRYRTLLRSV